MRHAEVTKSPCQAVCDLGCRGAKYAIDKRIGASAFRNNCLCQQIGIRILGNDNDDRNSQNCREHQKSLEEVGPAYGLISAKEGINDQNCREDQHSRPLLNRREEGRKDVRSCHKGRCYVNRKAYEEDDRAGNLQNLALGCKAIREVLRQGQRVVSRLREATETASHQNPVERRTESQTDTDPNLTETEGKNASGQTHQEPCTHIGSLRAHSRYPRTHRLSTEEVILFGLTLRAQEKPNSDAKHGNEIGNQNK